MSRSKKDPKAKPTVRALRSLRQAVLTWQLALHWLHIAADAAASASTLKAKPAQELAWWPLVAGASAPGFMKPGTTPGLSVAGFAATGTCSAVWPASLRGGQGRQRAACFGDGATARATKQCFSAVAQLNGGAALELAKSIAEKAGACDEAAGGALSAHVAAVTSLISEAEGGDAPEETEEEGEDGSSPSEGDRPDGAVQRRRGQSHELSGGQHEAAASAGRRSLRRGVGGAVDCEVSASGDPAGDHASGRDGAASASASDCSDSAENENGRSCQRAGNGGGGERSRDGRRGATDGKAAPTGRRKAGAAARSVPAVGTVGEQQPRSVRATRRPSRAAVVEPALRGAAEERPALAPMVAGGADEEASEGAVEAPRRPPVRRGHRQTNGQFLVQEAERAAAREQGVVCLCAGGDADIMCSVCPDVVCLMRSARQGIVTL